MRFNYLAEKVERSSDGSLIHNWYGMGRRVGLKVFHGALTRVYLENFVHEGLLISIDPDGSIASRIQKADAVDDLKFFHQKIVQVNLYDSSESTKDLRGRLHPELLRIENRRLSNLLTSVLLDGFGRVTAEIGHLIAEGDPGGPTGDAVQAKDGFADEPHLDGPARDGAVFKGRIDRLRDFTSRLRGRSIKL